MNRRWNAMADIEMLEIGIEREREKELMEL
jgi:hypothetical protein